MWVRNFKLPWIGFLLGAIVKNQLHSRSRVNSERCKIVFQIKTWCIPFHLLLDAAINREDEFAKFLNGSLMGMF